MMKPFQKEINPMSPSVIIWTHLNDPDRSKQDRLDRSHPRVVVGSSMLYAYSLMRGSIYSENEMLDVSEDPLYHALFNTRHRKYSTRAELPRNGRSDSIESLNKGIKFYWDPILSISYQECPVPGDLFRPPKTLSPSLPIGDYSYNLKYEGCRQRNSIFTGTNHYKGDAINANFGYLLIGNLWVDPDSAAEVSEALLALQGEFLKPSCILGPPLSIDHGPHIMCDREADTFYQNYLKYVTEDTDIYGNVIDQEGDPRISRISPETFMMWAAGATVGERYEKTCYQAPEDYVMDRGHSAGQTQQSKWPEISLPQFINETESCFSDKLSLNSDPSNLWSASGVKTTYESPAKFAYSYPHIHVKFIREAYAKLWVNDQLNNQDQTELSLYVEEVYMTEVCQKYLNTISDGKSGRDAYSAIQAGFQKIRDEGAKALHDMQQTLDMAKFASERKEILMQQVFYLQNLADQAFNSIVGSGRLHPMSNSAESYCCPKIKSTNEELPYLPSSYLSSPLSPPILSSTIPHIELPYPLRSPSTHLDLRPKRQAFVRYLKKQLYKEIRNVGKIYDQKKYVAQKCEKFETETNFWARKREFLLASLDIKNIDQVPGLIPLKSLRMNHDV